MSLLGEPTYALITPSSRSIGTLIPNVTVEESHRDELIITQHPVEMGATITDHAFKRPAELDMRCGWSNASAGYVGYIQEIYQALLALQASRQPFSVSTGKRRYTNMLIRGLQVVTDPHSENVLMVAVSLQEIILVSTSTTGTGTDTTSAGSGTGGQADPATTSETANGGSQSTTDVGSTAFAGSFNPGQTNPEGGGVQSPSFTASLDGISPPTVTADVGEMTVQDGVTGEVLQQGDAPAASLDLFKAP